MATYTAHVAAARPVLLLALLAVAAVAGEGASEWGVLWWSSGGPHPAHACPSAAAEGRLRRDPSSAAAAAFLVSSQPGWDMLPEPSTEQPHGGPGRGACRVLEVNPEVDPTGFSAPS